MPLNTIALLICIQGPAQFSHFQRQGPLPVEELPSMGAMPPVVRNDVAKAQGGSVEPQATEVFPRTAAHIAQQQLCRGSIG